jgi:hypothetical protein
MAQKYLSAARQWEANLKGGVLGVDEAGFGELPQWLRSVVWLEAMCTGKRCNTPAQATFDAIEDCDVDPVSHLARAMQASWNSGDEWGAKRKQEDLRLIPEELAGRYKINLVQACALHVAIFEGASK